MLPPVAGALVERAPPRPARELAEPSLERRDGRGGIGQVEVAPRPMVRAMVARYRRDGYKGTATTWAELASLVGL